jgi:hypothetical protein
MSDYRRGLDWQMDLLTRLGTTSNYSAIADLRSLRIITAHAKPVIYSLLYSLLGNSSQQWKIFSFCAHAVARWLILLTTGPLAVLGITSRHGPHRKHPVSNSNSSVACAFVSTGTYLPSRCPEAVAVHRVTVQQRVYTPQYYWDIQSVCEIFFVIA